MTGTGAASLSMSSARKNPTSKTSNSGARREAPGEAHREAAREIELKLVVDPPTLARIRKAGALSRLPGVAGSGRSTVHNLTSLYWDTENHALARAGIALRVRSDGGRVVQALKVADSRGGSGGLVANRAEDEALRPAADALAPPDLSLVADEQLRARAVAAIGDENLIPIFESAISRVARVLETSGHGSFEAALDLGEVRLPPCEDGTPGLRTPICEIELEHISGPVETLFDVARALADKYPVKVGTVSKVERGFGLAARRGGLDHPPKGPSVRAGRSPVEPGMTARQAYGALLAHCARQMAANQAAILTDQNASGIHQMRVAMRRLRSVHAAFKPVRPPLGTTEVIEQVKRLFRPLGTARDLDIFCTETMPTLQKEAAGVGPSLVPLAAAAEELRREAWTRAIRSVDDHTFTRMLLDLGHLSATASAPGDGSATSPDATKKDPALAPFARSRLDRRYRQVVRQGGDLKGMDDEARHDLRKRLKSLRYEAAFFAPLWPRHQVKAFVKPLKRLQDEFGAINDAATAASVARLAAERIGGDRAHEAAGFVGGWYAARADLAFRQVVEIWPFFEDLPRFWQSEAKIDPN